MKIILVVGTRPNFIKIAPLLRELRSYPDFCPVLVHTGQHYDYSMSQSFFETLGITNPDYNLEIGSSTTVIQLTSIMIEFEKVCIKERPDLIIVVGDVNSTLATAITANKLGIKIAHVESGLRSFDRTMPEEINRSLTDRLSNFCFVSEKSGIKNLKREGIINNVFLVGNIMIDNLLYQLNILKKVPQKILPFKYICLTLHRPSNVDDKKTLTELMAAIEILSKEAPVFFPCHPRTQKKLQEFIINLGNTIHLMDPMGYNEFLNLWINSSLVLTDSGGLQEETTALKIPCLTLRENTERPITIEIGSNMLVGSDRDKIIEMGKKALKSQWKHSSIPELWDGKTSGRILETLKGVL